MKAYTLWQALTSSSLPPMKSDVATDINLNCPLGNSRHQVCIVLHVGENTEPVMLQQGLTFSRDKSATINQPHHHHEIPPNPSAHIDPCRHNRRLSAFLTPIRCKPTQDRAKRKALTIMTYGARASISPTVSEPVPVPEREMCPFALSCSLCCCSRSLAFLLCVGPVGAWSCHSSDSTRKRTSSPTSK